MGAAAGGLAVVGAGVGAGVSDPNNTKVDAKLSPIDLHELAKLGLAILYGASHQGFGLAGTLDETRMRALVSFVDTHQKTIASLDWCQVGRPQIVNWCQETYTKMEHAKQEYLTKPV
jgi:hypothetical protein